MFRLLPIIIALFVSSSCALGPALRGPAQPVYDMEHSVVRIHGEMPGSIAPVFGCTAFSVGERLYLTAAHCVPESIDGAPYLLRLNRAPTDTIKIDRFRDLALIRGSVNRPVVTFRDTALDWLEEVQAIGFAEGYTMPVVTKHTFQRGHFNLGYEEIYPGNMYTNQFIGGMSGGPVFDKNGQVAGMVQRSNDYLSYGVDSITLMEFLREF